MQQSAVLLLLVVVNQLYSILFGFNWFDTTLCDGLMFLSDITRPAFLIDLRAVQRAYWTKSRKEVEGTSITTFDFDEYDLPIPPILLPGSRDVLVPYPLKDSTKSTTSECPHTFDQTFDAVADILHMEDHASFDGDICFGYVHCQVVKPSSSQINDPAFLCQLNLNSTTFVEEQNSSTVHTTDTPLPVVAAHLVLGLNNHHVISYYWARSAGSGAAMEAPGVMVVNDATSSSIQIRWASPEGYTACNSNDGKRSEWVQYLKEDDQIQLRPNNFETTARSEAFRENIFGITMLGRPLGSEPIVVCQWNIFALS